MDEYDGMFRIATTGWGSQRSNNLFVLTQVGDQLEITGSLTGLAKGERIYSVRFMGKRAYVVTFRQVDPLHSVDLSDPSNPVVSGELEIPGYSAYLHPMGEDHLIGFGMDGNDAGQLDGLQLSLFDVNDLSNPLRIDKLHLEGRSSEAMGDHHAFSYFPDQNTLAVPVGNSLEVFTVTAENGLKHLGSIVHNSSVRRSVRIGEFVYSLSAGLLKVNRLDQPDVEVAAVELPYEPIRFISSILPMPIATTVFTLGPTTDITL